MIDSLYYSSRRGVKTLLWITNKLRKALLFITKYMNSMNGPSGLVQILRNE